MSSQHHHDGMTSIQGEKEPMPDMNTWLEQNRLTSKFQHHFEEYAVLTADLLNYNENDMDELIDELKITAKVYKKRFKDAVRELQFKYNDKASSALNANQIYRVVMSTEESTSMNILNKKLSEIDAALQVNDKTTGQLLEETRNKEAAIESAFVGFRNKLKEREKMLQIQLTEESNKQLNGLKVKKTNMERNKKTIAEASKEQNELILDPNMDKKKREIKIREITTKAIDSMGDNALELDGILLELAINTNAVNKYISSIGCVSGQLKAPVLTVSDITLSSAKVKLQSTYTKQLVRYNIKYRTENDDSKDNMDDQKEMEWNEVDFENDDERTLTDLQRNTKYEICARYKVLENSIVSSVSALKSFQTINYPPFEWNPQTKHKSIVLSKNNTAANTTDSKCVSRKVVAKNSISGDKLSKMHWEVTIIKRQENNDNWGIAIGYVAKQAMTQLDYTKWVGASPNECGLDVYTTARLGKFDNASHKADVFDKKWQAKNVKTGDRIGLIFNFVNHQCVAHINDELIGTLTENLPNDIYPAVSFYYQQAIQTTKWLAEDK
eukprot:262057_1